MIATYNQLKSEMQAKEVEFTRELQRAQYTQSRALTMFGKLIGKAQARVTKRGNSRR